nr:hypothetical protein [Tanacetum cinerariifolium]
MAEKDAFLVTTLKVVYVLTTLMPTLLEDATVEAIRIKSKWENDNYICKGHILNCMSDSLFDVYTNVESAKELWDSLESKYMDEDSSSKKFLVQLGSHLRIEESLRVQDSDKGRGKKVGGPSVNMIEDSGKNKHHKQNKGKKRSNENNNDFGSNKKPKLECWKCGKTGHFKRDFRSGKKNNTNAGGSGKGSKDQSQDNGQNLVHVWNRFVKFSVSLISEAFYVQVDAIAWWIDSGATTHVCKDRCCVALEISSGKTVTLFNVLYAPKIRKSLVSGPVLNKCGYKQVHESDKYILSKCGVFVGFGYYKNGHVHYKRMLEMSKDELILAIDENSNKCTTCNKKYVITFIDDASRFCYVYLLHAKDEALDKFRIYKTEVELQQNDLIKTLRTDRGGEYYDPVFFQYVGVIHETTAPYTPQQNGIAERKNIVLKEMVNSMLSYSGLSEGFWGEAMLTACYLLNKGYRAVVRLPDPKRKSLGEKGIDCVFVGYAEHSKAYRPKDIIPNSDESQRVDHSDDVPSEISKPHKGKRVRKAKSYGFDFRLYLVEGLRDQVGSQYSYCYSIEEDTRTYNEAMQSRDAAFWKEAIDDEIRFIIENNTWVLSDLPPGCKPLGCKWIFKKKMKVDGTIDKFKARLVIQGFRQKEGIDYFDTYALVARITTIKLLLALAAIHNLVIHQMDVKTTFLNGGLNEEVYMKQPEGFVMPGNEHKLFDKTKKFLSLRFSMKDMGEAENILSIKIKHKNKGIVITQFHYIEKILKKFNREDCSSVRTLMDPVENLKPNTGKPVDQLEYSRAIGFMMYAMTSTRPNIAYVVGRLSTKDYGLSYVGYPSVLEGYSYASWINHVEDSSSTSGWVFLLGGALDAAGKEVEWLRNLIHEIPIWLKPIAPISIRCDSAPTMARAYSQIYNRKYRHLGVRHSMVRELIRNGVISIEFVQTQHNLADHLTKGLARDLVYKSVIGMGLKSI